MLKETLEKLEAKIKASPNIPEEKKQEYYALLSELNEQVNSVACTDLQKAESIKEFTKISTHEATRDEVNPNLLRASLDGLQE